MKKLASRTGCGSGEFVRVSILILLLLSLNSPDAGSQTQQPKQSDPTVTINTDLVVTDAHVVSKKSGRTIGGLKQEDFLLYEDGVQQELTHFSQDKLPLSVLLLLDVSGSMQSILARVSAETEQALLHLKPEDEVAVMLFGTRAEVVQDFTHDRKLIADQIGRIEDRRYRRRIGSFTNLNEAVYQAAIHLDKSANPISRRVIIAVTDNLANPVIGHSEGEAFERIFESGSVVCGIFVRDFQAKIDNIMRKDPVNMLYRKVRGLGSISTYANKTGGEVMDTDETDLDVKLAELIDHLRTRYSLGYAPPNANMDGKFRKLKLKVTSQVEAREGEVVVRTRQGYYARKPLKSDSEHSKPRPEK